MTLHEPISFDRMSFDADEYRTARACAKRWNASASPIDRQAIEWTLDRGGIAALVDIRNDSLTGERKMFAKMDPNRSRCADAQTTIFTRRAEARHPSTVAVPSEFAHIERYWREPAYRDEVAAETIANRQTANAAIDAGMAVLVANQEARWAAEEHAKAVRSAVAL